MALKRAIDLLVSITLLILLSPVLSLTALGVWIKLGRPIIFRQQRPGLHGRPFTLIKFRTMTDASDAQGNLLPDAERLTSFGCFLRSSSLDELPELINVLRGEMSLVGPRPLLMEYLERYTPEQRRRHEVKPGITGWAQVNGRQNISFSKRLAYDIWYVDHRCLTLDLKIMLFTLSKVLTGDGVRLGQDIREVDDLGLHC
jgi:sugar transferase EpsL